MAIAQTQNKRTRAARRFAALFIKLAVSGGLAWYLVGRIDLADSATRLSTFDPGWGIAALAVFALMFFLGAVRWLIFTRALEVPLTLGPALRIFVIGQFFGQALPAGIGGDAVRVWLLIRRGASIGPSVSSVLLDRLIGFATLLILIAATLPVLFSYVDDSRARLGVVLMLLVGAAGFGALIALSYVPGRVSRWPTMHRLSESVGTARRTALSSRPALRAFGLSFVLHLLLLVSIYLLALGLSLELEPLACLALLPPVILLSTLPISLAGWGVREGATVAALHFAGVPAGDALALSVLFGIALLVVSLVGSMFWLAQGREARRRTESDLEEAQEAGGSDS